MPSLTSLVAGIQASSFCKSVALSIIPPGVNSVVKRFHVPQAPLKIPPQGQTDEEVQALVSKLHPQHLDSPIPFHPLHLWYRLHPQIRECLDSQSHYSYAAQPPNVMEQDLTCFDSCHVFGAYKDARLPEHTMQEQLIQ